MIAGAIGAARLYRWHVPRSRLTRAIEKSSARVVLLVAPAGYGKTTVAREWIAGKPCVWFQPTAASADPAAFASELARAAQPIVPRAGERVERRCRAIYISVPFLRQARSEQTALGELGGEKIGRSGPTYRSG